MKTLLPVWLCVLLSPAIALAQSAGTAPETPTDPPVARLPSYIAFTKDFTYPPTKILPTTASADDKERAAALQEFAQAANLQRLEIVKTGDIRQDIEHYVNGMVQQAYRKGDLTCTTNSANPNEITVSTPWMTRGGMGQVSTSDDFPELDWVTASAFKGISVLNGQKVFQYQVGDQMAEIDAKTRLPLHVRTADFEVVYTYLSAPTEKLVLPDKFVKKLEEIKRGFAGAPPVTH